MSNSVKLSAMDRINALLDTNSFVEIGALVTKRSTDFNLQQKEAASDGVITGYGSIEGRPVYVYSQDISVLNGTIGEMHARKITNLYDLATKTGTPIVNIIDCGGLRLQEATDALNGVGEIFTKQVMASGVIPQISVVLGTCAGASAVSSSLCDFTILCEESGRFFVNAPDTLEGNNKSKCDTSKSDCIKETANVDFICTTEEDSLEQARLLISLLPSNCDEYDNEEDCLDDLNRITDDLSVDIKDSAYILSSVADNGLFVETKKDFAKEMVTGFIKLDGLTIGCIANRSEIYDEEGKVADKFDSVLTTKGCNKAADFVELCDSFNIPLLVLNCTTGYVATKCQEKTIAKAAAKLTRAFATAEVPKVTLVTGKSYTSAYVVMNSKHIGADLVFAWPETEIAAMEAVNAAKIIYADDIAKAEDANACINEKAGVYSVVLSSAESAAKRGYVDSIIAPEATRKNLIYAFEMLYTKI